jgi:hypothetical protein
MNKDELLECADELEQLKCSTCDELVEFAIWMTGCGYDFDQHEYFRNQRDRLLLGKGGKHASE